MNHGSATLIHLLEIRLFVIDGTLKIFDNCLREVLVAAVLGVLGNTG